MVKQISILVWLAALWPISVAAHQTSDSYLALSVTNGQVGGHWSIALRDLDHVLAIDANQDGEVSDQELTKDRPKIENYVFDRLKILVDSKQASFRRSGFEIEEHSDTVYAAFDFQLTSAGVGADYLLTYTLFNDADPLHRGLFRFDLPNRTETAIFSPAQPTQRFYVSTPQMKVRFANFIEEGIWHIWTGFDHILFLVALLLPSVLKRNGLDWEPAICAKAAISNILKVVTAFTIAHSITLTAATLGWVRLPSRLVESVIAASVIIAAINNLRTIFTERTWMIAFAFGLIHGFGFASALTDLHLSSGSLVAPLLGFNLGVEVGQLAIVFIFVPIAFALRKSSFYQQFALRYSSLLIAILAGAWLFERALDRKILPF